MEDSQADAAIEVTDVDSAAEEIARRMDIEDIEEEEEVEGAEPEPTDEESEDIEEDVEEEVEQEPEETEEEESTESFNNVEEIAEALGMPLEDFMANIQVTRKIDGVEESVPLSEVIAGNQRDTDYRHKTMELAEQRRSFEQQAQQQLQQYEQQLTQAQSMAQLLENQMLQQYQSIDWNELEQSDPQEWLVLRQKFQEDYAKVGQIKENAQAGLQQQHVERQQQQEYAKQQYLAKENELLLSQIPDWQDANTRQSETKQITDFLSTYGFSSDDVAGVTDHRLVKLVRDAMKSQSNLQQADIAKKKVKNLPKIVKPSAKLNKSARNKKQARDALGRYQKSGSNEDLAALLMDRM